MTDYSDWGMQLAAYRPMGPRLGVLKDVMEMTVTVPVGEMPTLTASYPSTGVHAEWLDGEVELAVEWTPDNGETWYEASDARFITVKIERDLVDDGSDVRRIECVHISEYCQHALVWQAPKGGADKDGKWNFLSVTPGAIVSSVWNAAKARGWGQVMDLRGTDAVDAAGAKWASIMTIAYDPSIDLWQVVKSMWDLGILDYRWEGRELSIYNPNTVLSRSRNNLIWRLPGAMAAGETKTWQDMCTDVLVTGEGAKVWHFHNTEAPADLRRMEKTVSAGGVEKEETAKIVAQRTLKSGAHPEQSVKREWVQTTALLLPWKHYEQGDWMWVERADGREWMRVQQVSVTMNANGVSGHVTFGSLLDDYLTRLAKKTKGIAGLSATSGSGVRPNKPADRRKPKKPEGGVGAGVVLPYENGKGYWSAARLTWAPVTTDDRGVEITIARYVAQAEYEVHLPKGGSYWQGLWHISSASNAMDYPNLDPGVQYRFHVYAESSDGVYSDWSDYFYVKMPTDTEPPPDPSTPVLRQRQGVLTVTWDGRTKAGASMPADVSYLNVGIYGLAPTPAAFVQKGSLPASRGGQCIIPDLPLNTPLSVALKAVDKAGNESAWGRSAPITLTQAGVDPEVIRDQVSEALKKGDALSKATKDELLKMFAQMGRSDDVADPSYWVGPPGEGVPGRTLWVSPDGRIFRCKKRGRLTYNRDAGRWENTP